MSDKTDPAGTNRAPLARGSRPIAATSEPSSDNDALQPSLSRDAEAKGTLRPGGSDTGRERDDPSGVPCGRRGATRMNDIWVVQFVGSSFRTGRTGRVMTVFDEFAGLALAVKPHKLYRGRDIVRVLESVCKRFGHPASMRIDHGAEWTQEFEAWAARKGIDLAISAEGIPSRKAFRERKSTARPGRSL